MKKIWFLGVLTMLLQGTVLGAPTLPEVEKQLKKMAFDILNHDSLTYKIELNKKFAALLFETLARPESYDYAFDSLKTVSILRADDNAFRIFTWYIVDKNYNEMYGEQYHYHFGLVQRKYIDPKNGKVEYIVIPLIENPTIKTKMENEMLDNSTWLGALYYPLKTQPTIKGYDVRYRERPKSSTGKPVFKKKRAYLLLGWNGADNRSNYKVADMLSFDLEDKNRVLFGLDCFYFDRNIPKYRAIFKYSEYAPFTMNIAKVKWNLNGLIKKDMIVYDHLATPVGANAMTQMWELGPDGSYDALYFRPRLKAFFWLKNVAIADRYDEKLSAAKLRKIRQSKIQAAKDLYGKDYKKYIDNEDESSKPKAMTPKELKKKQLEEERKQKEAGIDVNKNKKKTPNK